MNNPNQYEKWSEQLAEPFPENKVKWLEKGGLSLAYIDARDCQSRLDQVVGIENWQVQFEDCGGSGRLTCCVSIRFGDTWVKKSDGAGGSQANKGFDQADANKSDYSEAFKRACVQWRIGRYLYFVPKSKDRTLPEWATPEGWKKLKQSREEAQ